MLGQGGFGIVYRASHIYFKNKYFAIKEFFPVELATRRIQDQWIIPNPGEPAEIYRWLLGRFLQEAQILREFTNPTPHPNIVRVEGFHEANGTAYMVMTYEEGEPLSEKLEREHSLSEDQIDEFLYPLLDGLEQIHNHEIWHRDIKPSNILIRTKDNSPVLIDFGTAKRVTTDAPRTTIAIHTPRYAAPEQSSNSGKQGPWTDIYSLGVTLYHAAIGKTPDKSQDSASQAGRGRFHPDFLAAIDKAISFKPEDRPQSVAEFRMMLPHDQNDSENLTGQDNSTRIQGPGIQSETVAPHHDTAQTRSKANVPASSVSEQQTMTKRRAMDYRE